MFQKTVKRIKRGFPVEDIFVITGQDYVKIIREQAPEIPVKNIIVEPVMRDTLAAVGYAITYLNKKYPGTIMAAIWGADHLVRNEDVFVKVLKTANKVCEENNCIVRIGVSPVFPSTQLGYVMVGKSLGEKNGFQVFEFKKAVEKPDLKTAKRFLESFSYLWNTGYFVWPVDFALQLYKKYAPDTYQILEKIDKSLGTSQEKKVLAAEYPNMEKNSVDYGIFEKINPEEELVIPADLGWADIGAWNVLKEQLSGEGENVESGLHVGIDSKNNLIYGPSTKLITTIGIKDMVVVDTGDALLICPQDRAADVKTMVKKIEEKGLVKYL